MTQFKKLFSPMNIGRCEIKNRIVMEPMCMGFGQFDGTPTEKLMNYYEERAKGGAGLIVTEITRVNDKTGAAAFAQLAVSHDYHIRPLREMAERIHKHGAKFFVQLHHPGRQNIGLLVGTIPLCIRMDKATKSFQKILYRIAPTMGKKLVMKGIVPASVAPSKVEPSYFSGGRVRELRYKEIKQLINQFVDGADRVRKAGCDGVMLHAAHGYLIQQFLSPNTNKRTDEYGGSLENRMRFLLEIIAGIRERCKDFPLVVRLSVDECYDKIGEPEKGYGLEEGLEMAKMLEEAGIDAIDVSSAAYDTFNYWLEPTSFEPGWRRHYAARVKEIVKIPVIAANLIRSGAQAEAQLDAGIQDFIGLGRPHIADPWWAKKVEFDRENEVKRCVCCLYCFESMQNNAYIGEHGRCSVNPFVGREKEKLLVTGGGRRVVVVGAGPAGLMAAEILSRRGFRVTVLEEKSYVGGQVALSAMSQSKEMLGWCVEDLKYAAEKKGTKIVYNIKATPKAIAAYEPYAVILATGGVPIMPAIDGISKPIVVAAPEVYTGETVVENEKVVVVGSGMTGLETALLLAKKGNEVTVVEMADKIAPGMWMQHADDVVPKLKELGATFMTSSKLVLVEDDGITVEHVTGKAKKGKEKADENARTHVPADRVVLALGVRPENSLFQELRGRYANLYLIGDAVKAGRIAHATEEAYRVASRLGLENTQQG